MPTDREIAEMILRGGGAGSITEAGISAHPLNVRLPSDGKLEYGLPEAVEVEAPPEPKQPEKPVRLMVGGVLSQAWDRGYNGPKD